MARDVNFMSAMAYQRADKNSLLVPEKLARKVKSDFVVGYYIENKDQLNMLGLSKNDFDVERNKIFNVLIMLTTDDMSSVIKVMASTFGKRKAGAYQTLWQTGVCNIDTIKYKGCIWQGLVITPIDDTKESLEKNIMEANLSVKVRTITGVDAEEVSVELVDQ